jgi:hypothetical protein
MCEALLSESPTYSLVNIPLELSRIAGKQCNLDLQFAIKTRFDNVNIENKVFCSVAALYIFVLILALTVAILIGLV